MLTKAWYKEFCQEWLKKRWNFDVGTSELAKRLSISKPCAEAIWYVAQRSRGTEEHLRRLIAADRSAVQPKMDWNTVMGGDEIDELERLGV